MKTLETLVPPLELCKQIPAGAFADSALVWWGACVYPRIHPVRCDNWHKTDTYPAPTMAEIMTEVSSGVINTTKAFFSKEFTATYITAYGVHRFCYMENNPATAALRVWLRINENEATK